MIKSFFIPALFVFFTLRCSAQIPNNEDGHSLLWCISGNGLVYPSYLFGTIHIICKNNFLWTERMKKALNSSNKVCFEMKIDDPELMSTASNALMDTSGKLLKDHFTPEQYKLVRKYFKDSLGFDLAFMQQLKPVALQTLLSSKMTGCNDPVSYEDSIMKLAQRAKKEIMGLETPQEQITALETIPEDTVIQEILIDIQSNRADADGYDKMLDAYRKQDLPALFDIIKQTKEAGENMSVFLDDRNVKWIPRMEGKMKATSVFFAVGAGHLWGENGVVSLLRKKGYKVVPVK